MKIPARARVFLRTAFFVGAALYIVGGPLLRQVVLHRNIPYLHAWRMFSGRSLHVCEHELRARAPDGSEERLDWIPLLGKDSFAVKSRDLPQTLLDAERLAVKLCAKRGEPRRDVRLHRRCASRREGWIVEAEGERDLCAAPARKRIATPIAPPGVKK